VEQGAVEARAWKTPDYGGSSSGLPPFLLIETKTASAKPIIQAGQGGSMLQPKQFRVDAKLNNNPQVMIGAIVMAHDVDEARTLATALFRELHLDDAVAALPKATIKLAVG
jgi:hypothetical protein